MTDNEIIMALERIIKCNKRQIASCKECLLEKDYPYCDEKLEVMCLDLINRQKAEIEILQNNISAMATTMSNSARATRHEAIKEFAERLKEKMFNYYECVSESANGRPYKGDTLMDYEVVDMIEDCIDNLVEEMTEQRKEDEGK